MLGLGALLAFAGFMAVMLASKWWGHGHSEAAVYIGAALIVLGLILMLAGVS